MIPRRHSPISPVRDPLRRRSRCTRSPPPTDNLIWLLVARGRRSCGGRRGPDAGSVLEYCTAHGLRLTTIFEHPHARRSHRRQSGPGTPQPCSPRCESSVRKRAAADVPGITLAVDDGDVVTFAGATGNVFLTEGHIDGHISFLFDGVLFCGDTLFGAGCGYLFDGPRPSKMHR